MAESAPGQVAAQSLVDACAAFHQRTFGNVPVWHAIAPGRVNLIGEHTDYAGGLCLPMTIDRWCVVMASRAPAERGSVRLAAKATSGVIEFSLDSRGVPDLQAPLHPRWGVYVRGVMEVMRQHSGCPIPSLDVSILGNVPLGGGLSSSAALEVATARMLAPMFGRSITPATIAALARRAENEFAGVPCGLMDQLVSAAGKADHALLIDASTGDTADVPLPPDVAIIVLNTCVRHDLGEGGYARLVKACDEAAARLAVPMLSSLISAPTVESMRASRLSDAQQRAVTHVVSENARVRAVAAALGRVPCDLALIGDAMCASHRSLQMLGVSCIELDTIVASATELRERAAAGLRVWGARLTGAGFGGCAIVLAARDDADAVAGHIETEYQARHGAKPVREVVQACGTPSTKLKQ